VSVIERSSDIFTIPVQILTLTVAVSYSWLSFNFRDRAVRALPQSGRSWQNGWGL